MTETIQTDEPSQSLWRRAADCISKRLQPSHQLVIRIQDGFKQRAVKLFSKHSNSFFTALFLTVLTTPGVYFAFYGPIEDQKNNKLRAVVHEILSKCPKAGSEIPVKTHDVNVTVNIRNVHYSIPHTESLTTDKSGNSRETLEGEAAYSYTISGKIRAIDPWTKKPKILPVHQTSEWQEQTGGHALFPSCRLSVSVPAAKPSAPSAL